MPLYLTLSRGPRADCAVPVVATSDPSVVQAVLDALRRIADESHGTRDDAWTPNLQIVERPVETEEEPPR
jgi:hypothetical protein